MVRFVCYLSIMGLLAACQTSQPEREIAAQRLVDNPNKLHSMTVARKFIRQCRRNKISKKICESMISPFDGKKEKKAFARTYPKAKKRILMPPESQWKYGIQLAKWAEEFDFKNAKICRIRNWYRPEPYNSRVKGGSRSSHIDATGIDIEYCSNAERSIALREMLKKRKAEGYPKGIVWYRRGVVIHIDFLNRAIRGKVKR